MVDGGIPPAASAPGAHQRFLGTARIRGPRWLRLPLLSLGTLGAQTVWSIDMAFAPPYLLELGLSKSAMAGVFLAGPLSGLIVQPLIGAMADNCTSKLGRRRPFLMTSCLICSVAILLLGFTKEFAGVMVESGTERHQSLSIGLAILSVYAIDFSVNAVTALNRALMVDVAAQSEQAEANAWAARLSGLGSVLSFLVGNWDLPALFPSSYSASQLQILSVLTVLTLLGTNLAVALCVREKVLIPAHGGIKRGRLRDFFKLFADLSHQARTLPEPIVEVFRIQFFASMAWFPVLFYATIWVGDIYRVSVLQSKGEISEQLLYEESTRTGSRALFYHSVLSLATASILPLLVSRPPDSSPVLPKASTSLLYRIKHFWTHSSPHLTVWWYVSQFAFSITMMATWPAKAAQSIAAATAVITMTGFSWAISSWIPFSLVTLALQPGDWHSRVASWSESDFCHFRKQSQLGILIQADGLHEAEYHSMPERSADSAAAMLLRHDREEVHSPNLSANRPGTSSVDHTESDDEVDVLSFAPNFRRRSRELEDQDSQPTLSLHDHGTLDHAGSILGLHNLALVVPQFLVTLLSTIIFALLDANLKDVDAPLTVGVPPVTVRREVTGTGSSDRKDAVGLIFRLGGVSSFVAGLYAIRLSRRYGRILSG
ncbi:MFS general substrate transporter [Violaceomyces palustris]|uniref:MFS general substrate transporter n=1 Tax=Violaceomyces palustris TaxID=1673888 RepID=A0ACD0NP23_9BASI|nr:MFS general substrate transporter [Violaceomyces palustris]